MATRGWVPVCMFGVGSVDVSYLWEVEHEGLVISVFRVWMVMRVFMFVYCVAVVGCLSSQWFIAVFAGIYACISFGVICFSPDSWQNWLRGA